MTRSRELFRALELAHYAERFRDKVFVIALPQADDFRELLLDVKVLAGYHIQVVLVTRDPGFELERLITLANQRGSRFHLSMLTDLAFGAREAAPGLDTERIRGVLRAGRTPVIAHHADPEPQGVQEDAAQPGPDGAVDPTFSLAAGVALRLGAQKLFLIHPAAGAMRRLLPRSHVLAAEMEGLPACLAGGGVPDTAPLFAFIRARLEDGLPDVVLLECRSAYLFEEVFTHDGAGILFNAAPAARIRPAAMRDVTDIALLLRPEIEANRIRPVDESEIEAGLRHYSVYEIDGLLVGVARLKPFGTAAELAQFSTLPRYRGKGRARELARHLVAQAREQGFRRVFALSVDPRMWAFFEALGFREVPRESLPADWRREYDLERPSRAFAKEL